MSCIVQLMVFTSAAKELRGTNVITSVHLMSRDYRYKMLLTDRHSNQ